MSKMSSQNRPTRPSGIFFGDPIRLKWIRWMKINPDRMIKGKEGSTFGCAGLCGIPSPPQSDSVSESIDPPPTSEITEMSKPSKSRKKSASTSQCSLKPPVDTKQRNTSHGSLIVSSTSTHAKAASAEYRSFRDETGSHLHSLVGKFEDLPIEDWNSITACHKELGDEVKRLCMHQKDLVTANNTTVKFTEH
ncbi:hypothetical protein F5146DRAFT_1144982 [Armillaria mellea]|nr:hypothetical protein F5146DRAFT_1144982 [Armillaria mellea]